MILKVMKKGYLANAMMCMMAFVGMTGFSGCSSEDEVVDVNPTYNPETGEVFVDLALSVSTANEPQTRMTSAATQATSEENFRGIENAYLATFKLSEDGKPVTSAVTAPRLISLGSILSAGQLNNDESRRVLELSMGTGTNALAFWAKASKTGTDREQGKVVMNVTQDLANTSFSLSPILSEDKETAFSDCQTLIAKALTDIMMSSITEVTFNGTTTNVAISFGDYAKITSNEGSYELSCRDDDPSNPSGSLQMCDLGDKLSNAFVTLNTIHANELRDGSGQAVVYMMSDLMSAVNSVIEATPASLQEAIAQAVAVKVKENVETSFDPTNGYQWRTTYLNTFPTDLNLPAGSVHLQFVIEPKDATDTSKGYNFSYAYKTAKAIYTVGGASEQINFFDPKNFMYPAELCYFGNSPIRVTNKELVASNYPNGATAWEIDDSWNSDDKIFVIGNGQSENSKSDALVVYKSGNMIVNGTLTHNGLVGPSDFRLKKDVQQLDGALDKVLNLRGVSFYWKSKEEMAAAKGKDVKNMSYGFSSEKQIGVIAQEIEEVLPELVVTDNDGFKAVKYENITPLLIEAIKELKAEKDAQDKKIEALEAQLKEILEKLDKE